VVDEPDDDATRRDWNDRDTSKDAADSNDRATMRGKVYVALVDADDAGLTDHELHDLVAPGSPDGNPRNRRVDLYKDGLVVEAMSAPGVVVKRLNRTGSAMMIVWRAVKPDEKGFARRRKSPGQRLSRRLSKVLGKNWMIYVDDPDGHTRIVRAKDLDARERP